VGAAVDQPHVQGVPEHERNLLRPAQISDPVPGKQTFDRHDDVRPKRGQRIEQQLFVRRDLRLQDDAARLVDDADGQKSGVQIDATVELMLLGVETHVQRLLVQVGA
jgi:hypothetical protein